MSATPLAGASVVLPAPSRVLDRAWKVDAAGFLLLALFTLVGYLAGLQPFLGAKADRARHDKALREAQVDRDDAKAENDRFSHMLSAVRDSTRSEEIVLEPFAQRHVRVGAVAQLAADSNVELDQITPQDAEAIQGVSSVVRVPIVLSGNGSYAEIAAFLRGLHAQFLDTSVETVHLLAVPGSNGSTSGFSVSLIWYARPDIPS